MNFIKILVLFLTFINTYDLKSQFYEEYLDSINYYLEKNDFNKALDCSIDFYYYSQREFGVRSKNHSDASYYVTKCLYNLERYSDALDFARESLYTDTTTNFKSDSLYFLKTYYLGYLEYLFKNYIDSELFLYGSLIALEHMGKENSKLYFNISNLIKSIKKQDDSIYFKKRVKLVNDFKINFENKVFKYNYSPFDLDSNNNKFGDFLALKRDNIFYSKFLSFDSLMEKWFIIVKYYGYGFVRPYELIKLHLKKGDFFLHYGLYDSAIIEYLIADKLCSNQMNYKFSNTRGEILTHLYFVLRWKKRDYKNSLSCVESQIQNDIVLEGFHSRSTISHYLEKISLLFDIGDKQNALRNLSLIEQYLSNNKNKNFKQSEFESTVEFYNRTINFYFHLYNTLASYYRDNNLPEKAINLFHDCEDIIIQNNLLDSTIYFNHYLIILRDITNCYLRMGRYSAADIVTDLLESYITNPKVTNETKSLIYILLYDSYIFNENKRKYYLDLINKLPKNYYSSSNYYKFIDISSRHCFYISDFNCVIENNNKLIASNSKELIKADYLVRLGASKMYINGNTGLDEILLANSKVIERFKDVLMLNSLDALKIKKEIDNDLIIFYNLYSKSNKSKLLLEMNYHNLLFSKFFIPKYKINNSLNILDTIQKAVYLKLKIYQDSLYLYKISNNKSSEIRIQNWIDRHENFLNSFNYNNLMFIKNEYDSLRFFYNNIPNHSIAIDFNSYNFVTNRFLSTDTFICEMYINDAKNNLKLIQLFNEKEIIKYKELGPNKLYQNKDFQLKFNNFYNVLKPSISEIYYSPSGILYNINLGALKDDDGYYLLEKYNLHQMFSTASLNNRHSEPQKGPILLIGNIFYDTKVDTNSIFTTSINERFSLLDIIKPEVKGTRSRNTTWSYLPGTKIEINNISNICKSKNIYYSTLTEDVASEENFKKLDGKSPKVIHIASHGYFFEQDNNYCYNSLINSFDTQQFEKNSDPMIRSGLILSGANDAWIGKKNKSQEDGILTAHEISKLDLSNTELVVLSACETGLGDINLSEGVMGLQRAFKLAGVKFIIMSLWSVPDKETSEFMTFFYSNWLDGKTIYEAFRETQLQMIKKYRENPEKWAAFILVE